MRNHFIFKLKFQNSKEKQSPEENNIYLWLVNKQQHGVIDSRKTKIIRIAI